MAARVSPSARRAGGRSPRRCPSLPLQGERAGVAFEEEHAGVAIRPASGRGRGALTSMLSRASLVRVFSSHVPSTGPPLAPARGGRACAIPAPSSSVCARPPWGEPRGGGRFEGGVWWTHSFPPPPAVRREAIHPSSRSTDECQPVPPRPAHRREQHEHAVPHPPLAPRPSPASPSRGLHLLSVQKAPRGGVTHL